MIEILLKLAQINGHHPELRFMQTVENALGNNCEDRFHMSDQEFLNRLNQYQDYKNRQGEPRQ